MSAKADLNETLRMYADYKTLQSCAKVGKKYHYDAQTVWRRFKMNGLKMHRPGGRKRSES